MQRVVVIGGGFAGLAAAVDLTERGFPVTVVEARARLGGRAYSFIDRATGLEVDNGQHAMMGCYTQTLGFLEKIGATSKLHRQPRLRVEMRDAQRGSGTIAGRSLPGPLHMLQAIFGYRLLSRAEQLWAALAGAWLMKMRRARDERLTRWTVDDLLAQVRQSANTRASFWYPLAIATLNEAPHRAAAAPLAEVLARAFFGAPADSQFVLPRVGLSALYTDDARRFVEARGGELWLNAPVAGIEVAASGGLTVRFRDGRQIPAAACVCAVPPRALPPVLPEMLRDHPALGGLGAIETSPIVSAHLWFDRPILTADFVGLIGTTTQWVFNRSKLAGNENGGQCVSTVISAGRAVVDWDTDRIAATVVDDVQRLIPAARAAQLQRAVVVKEKHATIALTPEVDRWRPPVETALDRFFLAGDWTRTGLPPVIEGAVASGQQAAACVVRRLRAH